jgi:cytosine deaminase
MTMTLRNGRDRTGQSIDLGIADDRITWISPASGVVEAGDEDLGGRLVLPPLVNGHAHLDKTHLGGPWQSHQSAATVSATVALEKAQRRELEASALDRAMTLARRMVEFGTGTVRAHVDVDPEIGLRGVERMLAVRDAFRGILDLQIVAFPQSGIAGQDGMPRLLEEAVRMGATAVGGLDPITIDGDLDGHLDTVFDIARRTGADVDIHLHSTGFVADREYRAVALRTTADLAGRVTLSHAYGLGTLEDAELRHVLDLFAEARIGVMTNGPAGPMPPVRDLVARGVPVFVGTDNIRDAWWPFGTGDVLETARTVAYQQDLYTDEELGLALEMVTDRAAAALGADGYGLRAGGPADLVVLDAENGAEAVAAPPAGRDVMRAGRWISRRRVQTEASLPG